MNLNVVAPINRSSYGVVSFYVLKALAELDVNVSWFPIGGTDVSSFEDLDLSFLSKFVKNSKTFDVYAPCLKIFHQNRLGEMVGKGLHTAYSFFELDPLQSADVHHISTLDIFFSPTVWAKDVCENANLSNICPVVIPPAVEWYNTDCRDCDGTVRFLHIGKFEERKCHKQMVEAFGEAFDIFDNVLLDMYCHNPFNNKEENDAWMNEIVRSKLSHKIKVLSPIQRHSDMLRNYSNYDIYLSFSRAEGYDLPLIEAMSNGLLCVATDSTAHKDYVTNENAIVVKSIGKILARDKKWFVEGNGEWDDYNKTDFVLALKEAKAEIETSKMERRMRAIKTGTDNTWKGSTKKILKVLNGG